MQEKKMLTSLTSTNQPTRSSVWGLMQCRSWRGWKKEEEGDGSRKWKRQDKGTVGQPCSPYIDRQYHHKTPRTHSPWMLLKPIGHSFGYGSRKVQTECRLLIIHKYYFKPYV